MAPDSMESPYRKAACDSPSRQLLWELGRLSVNEQERLYERLERDGDGQESLHRQALAAAAAEHDRIRQEAEVQQQTLEARAQLARDIKRQDDLRELERVRRERAEREATIQREKEAAEEESARRAEEEQERRRREREEQQAKQDRERQERERTEQLEAQKRADEEERQRKAADAEAKAKEAAIAARRKQTDTTPQKQAVSPFPPKPAAAAATTSTPSASTSVNLSKEQEQAEQEHRRYLEIWKQLKELRNFVKDAGKTNAELKKAMGDGRRMIRKCVGQLVTDSANPRANVQPNMEIRNVLRDAQRFTSPTVPVSSFLFNPPAEFTQPNIPALFLYLLHIFAKCLVSQFLGEVAIAPQTATTIGITGATIFAQDDCRWEGHSLIDIFVAKYHRVCPVLFGVGGSDDATQAGKMKLGWWWADDSRRTFATEQRHYERMTGLGAGFAAMTLRSYKSRASPYPAWHFWQAASRLLNVPPARITPTHLAVLKALLEANEPRVLDFFGRAGRVLLRTALVDLPDRIAAAKPAMKDSVHVQALRLIPDLLRSEKRLFL